MPVTIKDIALEAGVSYQAVSAVLNNKSNCRVSPQKRENIQKIARKLGYHVNFGYKLMRGQATRTVAIISAMRQIESEEHIRDLLLKLMQKLNYRGFSTYFNNSMTEDADENIRQIRELITRGAENFIFIGTPVGFCEIEAELRKNHRTFVGWNSHFSRNLAADSQRASRILLDYLKECSGELPLLILPGEKNLASNRFKALASMCPGIPEKQLVAESVIFTDSLAWDEKDFSGRAFDFGYQGAAMAFARRRPRALAFFTDNFALGGINWCHENGIKIGKDIFISGFNNIEAVRCNPYPVASAAHPVEESIEFLLREMEGVDELSVNIPLKIYLRPERTVYDDRFSPYNNQNNLINKGKE